jgi:type IV fimbrial biogenesis protein FimT
MSKQNGFTLTELIITVVIAGILASIAVPSFQDFIKNERIVAEANNFVASFYLARTESIKRNRRVTICRSANPEAAVPACSAGGWEAGYIVFTDGNPNPAGGGAAIPADGVFQPAAPNSEVLIKAELPITGNLTLRAHPDDVALIGSYVSYNPRGLVRQTTADGSAAQSGLFRLCDDRELESVRVLALSQTGRVRVLAGAGAADRAEACP